MNPQKWGPNAWRLLEQVAYNPATTPGDKQHFFTIIADILPCAKCRQSYRKFIRELPIKSYLESPRATSYWLYQIHNKVNDKLRKQGRLIEQDPLFADVYKRVALESRVADPEPMWNFLYTVALNYDPEIHKAERVRDFFQTLKRVMPYHNYQAPYKMLVERFPPTTATREALFDYVAMIINALRVVPVEKRSKLMEQSKSQIRKIIEQCRVK